MGSPFIMGDSRLTHTQSHSKPCVQEDNRECITQWHWPQFIGWLWQMCFQCLLWLCDIWKEQRVAYRWRSLSVVTVIAGKLHLSQDTASDLMTLEPPAPSPRQMITLSKVKSVTCYITVSYENNLSCDWNQIMVCTTTGKWNCSY